MNAPVSISLFLVGKELSISLLLVGKELSISPLGDRKFLGPSRQPAFHSKFPFVEYYVHVKLQAVIPRERKCFLPTTHILTWFSLELTSHISSRAVNVMLSFFSWR
jgi:hypothetical protein